MPTYRRDAAFAGVALAVFVAGLATQGATGALARPVVIAGGILGALLIEVAFLRWAALAELWARPAVQVGSLVAVLAAGLGAYAAVGPPLVAALCWGLATYFALLVAVLVLSRNPLTPVA